MDPVASRRFFLYGYKNIYGRERDFNLSPRAGWPGALNNRCVFSLIFPGIKLTNESIEPATIHG